MADPLTPAQRITADDLSGYWKYLERVAKEVASWPAWKRGEPEHRNG